jgi:two-component system cell cycle response regulator DivK
VRQVPDAGRFKRIKEGPETADILVARPPVIGGGAIMPKSDAKRRDPVPAPTSRVAPAHILVVEDNPLNRQLVHDILELRGHTVVEAATVDEACRLLETERPNLLLLDVQIPGGGGEAVIRAARQRPHFASLPIIAVTSLAMPGDRERLLSIGFQGYLSKPIDTRTFGAAIESYLKSAEGAVQETVNARQAG